MSAKDTFPTKRLKNYIYIHVKETRSITHIWWGWENTSRLQIEAWAIGMHSTASLCAQNMVMNDDYKIRYSSHPIHLLPQCMLVRVVRHPLPGRPQYTETICTEQWQCWWCWMTPPNCPVKWDHMTSCLLLLAGLHCSNTRVTTNRKRQWKRQINTT